MKFSSHSSKILTLITLKKYLQTGEALLHCLTPSSNMYLRATSHLKSTSHLAISMHGQRATGKIQRNNYHHGSCRPACYNWASSNLVPKGYFSLSDFYAWAACNRQNSKEQLPSRELQACMLQLGVERCGSVSILSADTF